MAACISDSRNGSSSQICHLETKFCKFIKACVPNSSNFASCRTITEPVLCNELSKDGLWQKMRQESLCDIKHEPVLFDYYNSLVLCHESLEGALAYHLAIKLSNPNIPFLCSTLFKVLFQVFSEDQDVGRAIREDLKAARDRDPACISYIHCFLNYKGFQAIQAHRAAHKLWIEGKSATALMIQSRVSEVFGIDIHPGARMGKGILLDHGTGVVIGETAVISDNVTMMHGVTLGGRGEGSGDRHPKIEEGVMLGAGCKVLGNIRVGNGSKIGAASVVLKEVPPFTTAVGNPARFLA